MSRGTGWQSLVMIYHFMRCVLIKWSTILSYLHFYLHYNNINVFSQVASKDYRTQACDWWSEIKRAWRLLKNVTGWQLKGFNVNTSFAHCLWAFLYWQEISHLWEELKTTKKRMAEIELMYVHEELGSLFLLCYFCFYVKSYSIC